MTPIPAPTQRRPMQAAYLEHIADGHAWAQCCRDAARDADAESWRRPGGQR